MVIRNVTQYLKIWVLITAASFPGDAVSQDSLYSRYGVQTLDSAAYVKSVAADPGRELVDLHRYVPSVIGDVRYATSNNFMQRPMYPFEAVYMRRAAADSLRVIQQELNRMGYGLKIFDAYRPYYITVAFYEAFRDTTYVASPYTGSRHNRGCAVDLTLIELKSGRELLMPTGYDDFSIRANSFYKQVPAKATKNRKLLQRVMIKHGFDLYPAEWWHFDFRNWRDYPLLNVPFEQLKKAVP
jgi:D-alanyl-D-alanine dipeptidase